MYDVLHFVAWYDGCLRWCLLLVTAVVPAAAPRLASGQPGTVDAGLSDSKFYFPTDVAIGPNNTVLVTDNHRIRMVTLRNKDAYIQVSRLVFVHVCSRVSFLVGWR